MDQTESSLEKFGNSGNKQSIDNQIKNLEVCYEVIDDQIKNL